MHTHSSDTGAAIAAAPGEQLGVRYLAQASHLSRGIEGGENAHCSLPQPTIPAGPENQTHNLRVQVQRSIHKAMTALMDWGNQNVIGLADSLFQYPSFKVKVKSPLFI